MGCRGWQVQVGAVVVVALVLGAWRFPPEDAASPRVPAPTPQSPASLDELLEAIRARHDLPALAAEVVHHDEVIARGAVGVRALGSEERVTVDDLWHIGSCTKAFTATLIALLVEDGSLSWETTIGEVFRDFAPQIRPSYLGVTVEQLLRHRSGLPSDRRPNPEIRSQLRSFPGSIRDQRRQVAMLILQQEPSAPPGTSSSYSNFGYLVVAAMAEQATGHSWEDLVRARIFDPLGMKTAGFGAPGTAGVVTQPRGHRRGVPVEPGPLADNPPVLGPAGTVHLSLADWGKFAALHLAGLRGDGTLLQTESFHRLHAALPDDDVAPGWGVDEWPGGIGRLLTHAGSNGSWFARIVLSPTRGLAIMVTTNISGPEAQQAADEMVIAALHGFDRGGGQSADSVQEPAATGRAGTTARQP